MTWTDAETFEEFKEKLANTIMLAYPEEFAEIILCTDANNNSIGATLHQRHRNTLQPLALFRQKLSNAERVYNIYY